MCFNTYCRTLVVFLLSLLLLITWAAYHGKCIVAYNSDLGHQNEADLELQSLISRPGRLWWLFAKLLYEKDFAPSLLSTNYSLILWTKENVMNCIELAGKQHRGYAVCLACNQFSWIPGPIPGILYNPLSTSRGHPRATVRAFLDQCLGGILYPPKNSFSERCVF